MSESKEHPIDIQEKKRCVCE
ncbi:hypothetical protein ACLBR5_10090 [Escherichia coli]